MQCAGRHAHLAIVVRVDSSQKLSISVDKVGDLMEQGTALCGGHSPPFAFEGCPSGSYGSVNILLRGSIDLKD